MRSPAFYKFLSVVLAVVLALGGAYAGKMIHDAQMEVDRYRRQQDELQKQYDAKQLELQKKQEFFKRLQEDPNFLDFVAREHLDFAKPDETIFRFDVDPLTGAQPADNQDAAQRLQLSTPPAGTPLPAPRPKSASTPPKKN